MKRMPLGVITIKNFCGRCLGRFNVDFPILVLVLVLLNIGYWSRNMWPDKDTIYVFHAFHTFYNNFLFHGELARWFPYGTYGVQSDFWQLCNLTPASYLVGYLGVLCRVEDALLVFKFSVFLEQLMLLLGITLLARELFTFRITRFFVCLGVLASTVWLFKVYWDFRIYYLLPLIMYLLVLFFRAKRGHYMWLAGIVTVFSLVGNNPYFGSLYALILLIFCCVWVIYHKATPPSLRNPGRTYHPFCFLLRRQDLFSTSLILIIQGGVQPSMGKRHPLPRPILAFKAIRVPAGDHEVQWVYRDGLRHVASLSIAVLSLGFATVLSGWIVRHCFLSHEHVVSE